MEHSAPHNEPCASAASARLLAATRTSSKSSNRISAIIFRIIPRKPCRGAVVSPLHCAMQRSILAIYERRQSKIPGGPRTQSPGEAAGGTGRHVKPDQGRESGAAPAAGNSHLRARQSVAQERAGARAGRSDDRAAEIDGTGVSDSQARVSVRILEKEYHVTCPMEERSDLLDSAEFLNANMREIRESGQLVGLDRSAVIAALNMANELIRFRKRDTTLETDVGGRLRILRDRVESALEKGRQFEI